jgi:hypothetical protein
VLFPLMSEVSNISDMLRLHLLSTYSSCSAMKRSQMEYRLWYKCHRFIYGVVGTTLRSSFGRMWIEKIAHFLMHLGGCMGQWRS